jgi:hypothetical protein
LSYFLQAKESLEEKAQARPIDEVEPPFCDHPRIIHVFEICLAEYFSLEILLSKQYTSPRVGEML